MEKKTVVLYPGFAVSHFVPMMQLAGALLENGYAVTVALIDPAVKDIALLAVVARAASSMPSVSFHTLPRVQDAAPAHDDAQFLLSYLRLVGRYNEPLHDFLCSVRARRRGRVHAVVVDSLSNEALAVTKRLGIPGYTLFTSCAAVFAVFAQIPYVLAEGQSFRELGDAPLEFLGLPPMPASHLPGEMLEDPESDTYKETMNLLTRSPEANGVLVNTFESLEPRAVAALRDPRCLPVPGKTLPPVYCVGPFLDGGHRRGERAAARVPHVAGRATGPQRRVPLLRQHGRREPLGGAAQGDRRRPGGVRPPVPVGRARPPRRPPRRPGPRRAPSRRVLAAHRRPGARRQAVGAAGGRAPPPGDGRVRDARRVELGAGGRRGGRADAVLAAVRGAEDEQGAHGGGDEGRRGDGRVAAGAGHGRRGGGQGEAGHGVRGGQGAEGAGGGAQGRRGCGVEGRRLVARGVWPVLVGRGQPLDGRRIGG